MSPLANLLGIRRSGAAPAQRFRPLILALVAVLAGTGSMSGCERERGPTTLWEAAARGSSDDVQRLLEAGGDPNEVDENGVSPVLAAIFAGNGDVVEDLVDAGAEIDAVNCIAPESVTTLGASVPAGICLDVTPLLAAAFTGDSEVARLLLERGVDPRFAVKDGMTALHLAAMRGNDELAAMLVARGVDLDAHNTDGETPLSLAAAGGHLAVAAQLLAAGARVESPLDGDRSPLEIAMERKDVALARLLEQYGATAADAGAGPIDTMGHDPLLASPPDDRSEGLTSDHFVPLGIAIDPDRGRIYWAEYAADRIRSSDLDGNDVRTVVGGVDGPIGVAVDPRRGLLFWTADASYPRKVQRAELAESPAGSIVAESIESIVEGAPVNRPRAIAIDAERGEVVWTEAVSGRMLRLPADEVEPEQIYSSGISSIADRPDRHAFRSLGLAIAERSGRLYWTDVASDRIQSAGRIEPGADEEVVARDLLTAADGVSFPAGIAIDEREAVFYWTDVARQEILGSHVDGLQTFRIVGREQGLVEPYGLALDASAGKLYWTDAARDVIARVRIDGSALEERSVGDDRPFAPPPVGSTCAEVVASSGRRYVAEAVHSVGTCLDKVDALKAVKREASDAGEAAATCAQRLSRWKPLAIELRGRLDTACRESDWAGQATAADALASACLRGNSQFGAWLDCMVESHGRAAEDLIARRYLRAGEWLEEVRPFLVARVEREDGDGSFAEAIEVIDALRARWATQPTSTGPVTGLPVTGQSTSYAAVTAAGAGTAVAVGDDGAVRAGFSRSFRDNRDGTVTDLRTGLVWEKKCSGCGGLHDVGLDLRWTGNGEQKTIWDWQAEVNAEGGDGFAGYSDWRIPNAKELQTLIDYERFNPAVYHSFDGDLCGIGCADLTDPRCSCTRMSAYWSSTTLHGKSSHAIDVAFHLGLVGARPKREVAFVRLVRGGTFAAAAGASDP